MGAWCLGVLTSWHLGSCPIYLTAEGQWQSVALRGGIDMKRKGASSRGRLLSAWGIGIGRGKTNCLSCPDDLGVSATDFIPRLGTLISP